MKLSVSNIGWQEKDDMQIYEKMNQLGYVGLEIAPTRILPVDPYEKIKEIQEWNRGIRAQYGFKISSMQSIWFGRSERIFGSDEERDSLIAYTKKAIDFAEVIGCRNLVFGCPRNRALSDGMSMDKAVTFFYEIGEYARAHGTVIGMEANPPIYHTNYINDTKSAIQLIREVGSEGFRLNLDVGTMIYNQESVEQLSDCVELINHVHISEPYLKPIQSREVHHTLMAYLKDNGYTGYISIEMGKKEDVSELEKAMIYIARHFG